MAKRPIYAFGIEGVETVFTTADLVRAGITGTLPEYEPWLKVPEGGAQTVDVVAGSGMVAELTCEVVDQGGFVRQLAGENSLCGAIATLSVGYPGIAWAQFVPLHTFILYKINPSAGYTSWNFVCRDRQILAKKTIYTHPENGERLSEDNPWFLTGSPTEIFQAVTLFGLQLAASEIDRAALAALDDPAEGLFAAARPFQFAMTESFEAKQFLESEILKVSGLYPVVSNTGRLSLRAARPPAAGAAAVAAFTQHNMIPLPVVDRMPVINEAVWEYDSNGSEFRRKTTYIEAESIGAFGRGLQWSAQSKGLRSELGAAWFAAWVSQRLFQRFAGTPAGLKGGAPTAQIEAFFLTLPVWVGDFVTVTHPKMPDVTTGALGVEGRLYEVVERSPDYARGRMKYKLLDTGLTGSAPSRQWGAESERPLIFGEGEWY